MHNDHLHVEYHGERIEISGLVRRGGKHLIVFLHGFGCAKECFAPFFGDNMPDEFTLLAMDFPGHGGSSRLADPSSYSLQTLADVANLTIDLFAPKFVSFVGHSMGGAVSLIASQARSDVYGIVDADGNLVAEDCGIVSRATANQTLGRFVRHGYQQFLQELQMSKMPDETAWADWYAKSDPVALHELACSLVEWSDSGKLLNLFRVQKRAMYLYGDRDRKDYLLSDLIGIDVHAISRSGHFMMLDNPVEFFRKITDFFMAELASKG
jgi:pimeloyl-ACP methyl ester carboxylesterase